jgi:hypothetical protein
VNCDADDSQNQGVEYADSRCGGTSVEYVNCDGSDPKYSNDVRCAGVLCGTDKYSDDPRCGGPGEDMEFEDCSKEDGPYGRGLHSYTFRLNLSAFRGLKGASRGYLEGA